MLIFPLSPAGLVFVQCICRILKKVSGSPLHKPEVNVHVMHTRLFRLVVGGSIQQTIQLALDSPCWPCPLKLIQLQLSLSPLEYPSQQKHCKSLHLHDFHCIRVKMMAWKLAKLLLNSWSIRTYWCGQHCVDTSCVPVTYNRSYSCYIRLKMITKSVRKDWGHIRVADRFQPKPGLPQG